VEARHSKRAGGTYELCIAGNIYRRRSIKM
jgi:hypothetical protein